MGTYTGAGYRPVRGEAHHSSKLTADDVRAIRKRYSEGGVSYKDLAIVYGVQRTSIYDCIKFRSWKHVK